MIELIFKILWKMENIIEFILFIFVYVFLNYFYVFVFVGFVLFVLKFKYVI